MRHSWQYEIYGWLRCPRCGKKVNYIELFNNMGHAKRTYLSKCHPRRRCPLGFAVVFLK
jgi:hypothetical protein